MPSITLQSRYTDGTVQFEQTSDTLSLTALLTWAVQNTRWARGSRIPGSDEFSLNDRLVVSIDGGAFVPVNDAVRAECAAQDRRMAA